MPTTGATGYDTLTGAGHPSATVTDFSLYVQATMSAAWQAAFAAAGADTGRIRVTDGLGTELPRDILSYSSGVLAMRVLWSGARGVGDYPVLRVYPDATGSYAVTDTYGGHAAYGSGWAGYYPLDEDPSGTAPQGKDRTANQNHLTTVGNMDSSDLVAGQLAGAWAFDGVSQYAESVNDVGGGTSIAILAWITPRETADGGWVAIGTPSSGADVYTCIRRDTTHLARGIIGDGTNGKYTESAVSSMPINERRHVAMTASVSEFPNLYVNGTLSTPRIQGGTDPEVVGTGKLYVGAGVKGPAFVEIDDVQLHSVVRSAAWIAYEYGITSNPTAFWANGGWTSLATGSSIAAIAAYYRRMRA